jgi:SAM-dependent methyltransferase
MNDELRKSWEDQQSLHEPDREQRFEVMLDYLQCIAGSPTRVLDLAWGPGSITRRVRHRFPDASVVALDIDPLLLRLATDAFRDDAQVQVVKRNLNDPDWHAGITDGFDAVLTATAMHWLSHDALQRVFAGAARLLRPGGIFANADHLPIADPVLRRAADDLHRHHLESAFSSGAESCDDWYERAYRRPSFRSLRAEREEAFAHWSVDLLEPADWHLDLLKRGGFELADVVWRRGNDAIVVAVRGDGPA